MPNGNIDFDPEYISIQKRELDALVERCRRLSGKVFVYTRHAALLVVSGAIIGSMATNSEIAWMYPGLLLIPYGLYFGATKARKYSVRHQDCHLKIDAIVKDIYRRSGLLYCDCSYPNHLYSPELQRVWGENSFVFFDYHSNSNQAYADLQRFNEFKLTSPSLLISRTANDRADTLYQRSLGTFTLGKGSKRVLAFFSSVFGLMLLSILFKAPTSDPKWPFLLLSIVYFSIAGASIWTVKSRAVGGYIKTRGSE